MVCASFKLQIVLSIKPWYVHEFSKAELATFVVVDGFREGSEGSYSLQVEIDRP